MLYNDRLKIPYYTIDDDVLRIIATCFKLNDVKPIGNRQRKYVDVACAFDIETSSFYSEKKEKIALMYHWQFGVFDAKNDETICITGRTWDEFRELLNRLSAFANKKTKCKWYLPVYVHNLSFEYGFLKEELKDLKGEVFYSRKNKPLRATFGNIEFRCSYELSGVKLSQLNTKIKKLEGELDYKKIRTPITPMTDDEIAYCLNDVRVLCEYINRMKLQDGSIANMRLTKTGYVRNGLHHTCIGDDFISNQKRNYTSILCNLTFHNLREYYILKECCSGGYNYCNPDHIGITLYDVTGYDFISSYPSVMCCEPEYPIAYVGEQDCMSKEQYEDLINRGYALYGEVRIKNIKAKIDWCAPLNYESCYFCDEDKKIELDIVQNKIIRYKGEIQTFLTNIDYETIKLTYNYDSIEFRNVYIYKKGYLPKPIIEYILKLYQDKTQYKGIKGKEVDYNLSKELLNSIAGCAITDPCKEDIYEDENGECKKHENTTDDLKEKCIKYNNNLKWGKITIAYQWGVYTLALARYNLITAINVACQLGLYEYSDTDSCYIASNKTLYKKEVEVFEKWIGLYNENIKDKMLTMCKKFGIDDSLWRPKTKDGVEKPLGYWDIDCKVSRFKCLGTKKYIKEDEDGIKITVSGLNKDAGRNYITSKFSDPFDAFNENLYIPADYTKKLQHTTIVGEHRGKIKDYLGKDYEYVTKGGVHMENVAFSMNREIGIIEAATGVFHEHDGGL